MTDHNLDDLIIDTAELKSSKSKSFLTIIALLLILLIVAIIFTKTFLSPSPNNDLAFEENLTTMIAPELKLEETANTKKPTQTTIEETEEIVKEPIAENLQIQKPVVKKPEVKKPEVKKPVVKKPEISKPVVTKPEVKKPVRKKPVTKPHTAKKPVTHTTTNKKYYVQVGSFKEQPSKQFLAIIKSHGFHYLITKSDAKGYKKLLIGPYKTRASVDRARDLVRDRIHKSAFVVQK